MNKPLKILVAPNAFKGSLSAVQAAAAMAQGLKASALPCEVDELPVADGGDDTLEVLTANGGKINHLMVQGPLGRPLWAAWGMMADGETAVVEMARASGLKLLSEAERDPFHCSTYGTGQLIKAAVQAGVKRIIVGVGGSATIDGGAGCMQALGVRLQNAYGDEVSPGNRGLRYVRLIDDSGMPSRLQARRVAVLVACDVDNPTLGPDGAVTVFGPQKGARPEDLAELETNLANFFAVVASQIGVDVRQLAGGGAAGGLSAGLVAFLGAGLRSGIELVLDALHFGERLAGADLVLTGEGRMDEQTLGGKGPFGVMQAAKERGIPTIAIVGGVGPGEAKLVEAGFAAVVPTVPEPLPLVEVQARAATLLEQAARRVGNLLALGQLLHR